MQTTISDTLDSLRQPQYTGENRCIPCTVVNVLIAVVLGVGLSFLLSPLLGVPVFVVSLALISLRGYLVPGTPAFTKRYFPGRLLAWFDKGPDRPQATVANPEGSGTEMLDTDAPDPEEILSTVDAVEPCENEDDLCLTPSFAAAWRDECRRLRDADAQVDALADLFETDSIRVESNGHQLSVFDGDRPVAMWPSEGALVADLAADAVLSSRAPDWARLGPPQRFGILAGLRSFLDVCPLCDGPIEMGEQTVESCCRSWDVLSVRCADCEAELLELDPETLETVA